MYFKTLALSLATATTTLASNAVVTNNCQSPVYLWSVGSSVGPQITIQPGANHTEPFRQDDASGGIALKVTRTKNGLYDGSPQLTYSYTLDAPSDDGTQNVWYDLSSVFGDAFKGDAVVLRPSEGSGCESICWPEGVKPAGGSDVKRCDEAKGDVELVVCAESC